MTRRFLILALPLATPVAAMPLAHAADSPGGFAYGTSQFGAGPHGSAKENRDRHHNRYAPQGRIPLAVPRDTATVSLRLKVEPPGATVTIQDMRTAGRSRGARRRNP